MPATPILGWVQALGAGATLQFWYQPDESTYRLVYQDPLGVTVTAPRDYAPAGHLGAASQAFGVLGAGTTSPWVLFATEYGDGLQHLATFHRFNLADASVDDRTSFFTFDYDPVDQASIGKEFAVSLRSVVAGGAPTEIAAAYYVAAPGGSPLNGAYLASDFQDAPRRQEFLHASTPVSGIGFAPDNPAIPASLAILSGAASTTSSSSDYPAMLGLRAIYTGTLSDQFDIHGNLITVTGGVGVPLDDLTLSVTVLGARDLVLASDGTTVTLQGLGVEHTQKWGDILKPTVLISIADPLAMPVLDDLGGVAGGREVFDLAIGNVHRLLATDGTRAGTAVLSTLTLRNASTIDIAAGHGKREILLVADRGEDATVLPVFTLLATDGSKAGTQAVVTYKARTHGATAETIDLGDTALLLVNDGKRAILAAANDGEALNAPPVGVRLLTLTGRGVSLDALGEARGGEIILARSQAGLDLYGADGLPAHTELLVSIHQAWMAGAAASVVDRLGDRALVEVFNAGDLALYGTDATAAGTHQLTHLLLDATTTVSVLGHVQGNALLLMTQHDSADLYVTDARADLPAAILHLDLGAGGLQATMLADLGGEALLGVVAADGFTLYAADPGQAVQLGHVNSPGAPAAVAFAAALPGGVAELIAVHTSQEIVLFASDGSVAGTHRLLDTAAGPTATPELLGALGGTAIVQVTEGGTLDWYATDGATLLHLAHLDSGGDPVSARLLLQEAGHALIGVTTTHAGTPTLTYLVTDGTVAGTHELAGAFDIGHWWL